MELATKKIQIKKKCNSCGRIRPLIEFKTRNGRCEYCSTQPEIKGLVHDCLKCEKKFEAKSKFNKVCDSCKSGETWDCLTYNVEI